MTDLDSREAAWSLHRLRRVLLGSYAIALLISIGLSAAFLGGEHHAALETATQQVRFRAMLFREHAERTIDSADMIVRQTLVRLSEIGGPAPLESRPEEAETLRRLIAGLPQIEAVWVADAEGHVVAGTTPRLPELGNLDIGDRPYFLHHRDGGHDLFISEAVTSRVTGNAIFTISRRVSAPDGSFAGVVGASLPLGYFNSFYRQLSLGTGDIILLANDEGQALFREPPSTEPVDVTAFNPPAEGAAVEYLRKPGDDARILAWEPLSKLPLKVMASMTFDTALAGWQSVAVGVLLLLGGAILALTAMLLLCLRLIRREEAASRRLEALSQTDGLMGIANRRRFDTRLVTEWRRCDRNTQPLSLLMIDVDAFKAYNDAYGHPAGDKVLHRVAQIVAAEVGRPGDLVARYGGEEIAVLLPETDRLGAERIANAIRESLHAAALPHAHSPAADVVTCSIGGACLTPTPRKGPEALLADADAALYVAKRNGRDRVVMQRLTVVAVS